MAHHLEYLPVVTSPPWRPWIPQGQVMLSQSGPLPHYPEASLEELPQSAMFTWTSSRGKAKSTWLGKALDCKVVTALPT